MNVTAILNGIASYTQHKSLWRLIYHGRMKRVVAHRQRARSWKDEESRMELEARFSAIHTFLYPYTYSLSSWLFFPFFFLSFLLLNAIKTFLTSTLLASPSYQNMRDVEDTHFTWFLSRRTVKIRKGQQSKGQSYMTDGSHRSRQTNFGDVVVIC